MILPLQSFFSASARRITAVVLLLLLLGLAAWGIKTLARIFANERDEAVAEIRARRTTLTVYASNAFSEILRKDMAVAWMRMQKIMQNPLLYSGRYYFSVNGEQRLPRESRYADYAGSRAGAIYQRLLHESPLELTSQELDGWSRRKNLFADFKTAIESADAESIRWAFRQIREHDALAQPAPTQDVPYMLAVLDYFFSHSAPSPSLVAGMLRGGSVLDLEAGRLGLQQRFLSARDMFNREDFEFISTRVIELSLLAQVDVSDFIERVNEQREALAFSAITEPSLVDNGGWYVEPFAGNGLRGMRINRHELMVRVQNDMLFLGLIDHADLLELTLTQDRPVKNLPIHILSPHWLEWEQALHSHYWIKTVLLYTSVVMLALIILLLGVHFQRERRLLHAKTEFISAVSHELRTPVASIRLMAETLQRQLSENTQSKHYPARIMHDSDRLGFLVENILSYNRLHKRAWVVHKEAVVLAQWFDKWRRDAQDMCDKPCIIDDEGVAGFTVDADTETLQIVFNNLLSNACKYNTREQVAFRVTVNGRFLNVCDNGVGIEADLWEKVFGEFYRHLPLRDRSIRGTGLGLAICRSIMRLHGGTIRVQSSGPNGTCFALTFPGLRETT